MPFSVVWEKSCGVCDAPLNISFFSDNQNCILKIISLFSAYKLNTYSNRVCYKPSHGQIYCNYCLDVISRMCNISTLLDRECGTNRCYSYFPKPIFKNELYDWCKRAVRILKDDSINWKEFTSFFKKNRIVPENICFITNEYQFVPLR
jgi:hypothetical protein